MLIGARSFFKKFSVTRWSGTGAKTPSASPIWLLRPSGLCQRKSKFYQKNRFCKPFPYYWRNYGKPGQIHRLSGLLKCQFLQYKTSMMKNRTVMNYWIRLEGIIALRGAQSFFTIFSKTGRPGTGTKTPSARLQGQHTTPVTRPRAPRDQTDGLKSNKKAGLGLLGNGNKELLIQGSCIYLGFEEKLKNVVIILTH